MNNILHGNKQDGKITEHDSGIDIDDMDRECDPPVPDFDCENTLNEFDELSKLRDEQDVLMTEASTNDASQILDTLNISAITEDDATMNTTNDISTDQTLNSTEQTLSITDPATASEQSSLNTTNDSLLAACSDGANQSLEISKELERRNSSRQSLDDGIGTSECNSPTRLEDAILFEGFNSNELGDCTDIDHLSGVLNAAGELINNNDNIILQKEKVPELKTNIFQLPENLLRRNRIFALTNEFEIWMASRKRKYGMLKPEPMNCGKLLKLSNGVIIRCDPDSDSEEFLGFDENNIIWTAPSTIVMEQNPATISNRTCSSDSGISPEKALNSVDDCNQMSTISNAAENVNDSGVAELNSSTNESLNDSTADALNFTAGNANQTVQETDLSLSDANVNANSTKLFNETASTVTGFDSGFGELESSFESSVGLDETNNLNATAHSKTADQVAAIQAVNIHTDLLIGELNKFKMLAAITHKYQLCIFFCIIFIIFQCR